MIRWALVSAVIATSAFAQEIGSEIQPAEATPAPVEAAPAAGVRPVAVMPGSTKLSAGAGTLGIRATFFGSPSPNLPTAAVGIGFFVTDLLKLTLDAGAAATFPQYPQNTSVGFTVAAGADLMFRKTTDSVRPFVTAQVGFGKLLTDKNDDFALVVNAGGGGEYFFSQYFSVNVRALFALPVNFRSGTVGLLLFTPGVGATVYF